MEVSYEITKDDLYEFNLYHFENSPVYRRNYNIYKYIVPFTYVGYAIYDSFDKEFLWLYLGIQLIVLTIMTIFWFRILKYLFKRQLWNIVRKVYSETKDKQTFGMQKLNINAEGISENNDFGESKSTWSAISEIVETETLILLYFGSERAYIVPKRAFNDEHNFRDFLEKATYYLKQNNET